MVVSSIVLMIDGDVVGIFGGGSDSLHIFVVGFVKVSLIIFASFSCND
jgi:hypothetical protein